ncbi:hypothetical protein M231_00959 [Tremella mesenterica]|uniref:Uncharacterized protein n=1 Tax=Tremella mesenterica TaxID=5217 RepID=A0A4Q1BUD5_TREME|nr:hypothetical protein M231_00959 [Tremella mesenterica]
MADSDVEMQEADTGEADEDVSMRDVIAVGAPHIHVLRAEETTPTTNNDGLNVSTSASSTAIVSDAPGSGTQNETGTSRRTINENLLSPTTPIKFTSPFLDPRNQVKQSPEGSANSDPPPLEVDPDNQRPRSVSMSEVSKSQAQSLTPVTRPRAASLNNVTSQEINKSRGTKRYREGDVDGHAPGSASKKHAGILDVGWSRGDLVE